MIGFWILDFGFWIGLALKLELFLSETFLYRKRFKQRSRFLTRSKSKIRNPKSKIEGYCPANCASVRSLGLLIFAPTMFAEPTPVR
jgi:hypothetical protein